MDYRRSAAISASSLSAIACTSADAASLPAPVGKNLAERTFEAAHDLLQAAEGDALRALFEAVQGRGREAELFGKLGEGHLPAPGAEEFAELRFQWGGHGAEAAPELIPDAE